MCENVILNNRCKITQQICPFMYFCERTQIWRANNYMPKNCKVKETQNNAVKHKGKYRVINYRKDFLYVEINDVVYKLKNPFDFVPDYVDVLKRNGVYIIKKRG